MTTGFRKSRLFIRLAGLLFLLTGPLMAQQQTGYAISGQALTPAGEPAAYATLRVCPYTGGGIPCTPTALIYSDLAQTHALANPYTLDQYGNYSVFVAPGAYLLQITPVAGTTYSYFETANIYSTPAIHAFFYPTLALAVAATPSGGTLIVDPGNYPVSSTITRTTPINVNCAGGAIITADQPWLAVSGHGADGTKVTGSCQMANNHVFQACTASQIIAGSCTSNYVSVIRFAGDTLGYPITVNDGDVYPYLTSTQKANFNLGTGITFTDVNNIEVQGLSGGRAFVLAEYTLAGSPSGGYGVNFHDNNLLCGGNSGAAGCLSVLGDGLTFVPSTGLTIQKAQMTHNILAHNGPSGALTIGNTLGADVGDNTTSYNGETNFKTYQSFVTYGNTKADIHDNYFGFTAGGCADMQPDYPPLTTQPLTYHKFTNNTCEGNGIQQQNGAGLIDAGAYDLVLGNHFINNLCYQALIEANGILFEGNDLYGSALGSGGCSGNSLLDIQGNTNGVNMSVVNNTIEVYPANSANGIFWNTISQYSLTLINNHVINGVIYIPTGYYPTVSVGNQDENGFLMNQLAGDLNTRTVVTTGLANQDIGLEILGPGLHQFAFQGWTSGSPNGLSGVAGFFDYTTGIYPLVSNATNDLYFLTPASSGNVGAGTGAKAKMDHNGNFNAVTIASGYFTGSSAWTPTAMTSSFGLDEPSANLARAFCTGSSVGNYCNFELVPFDSVGNPNTSKTLTYNGTSGALTVPGPLQTSQYLLGAGAWTPATAPNSFLLDEPSASLTRWACTGPSFSNYCNFELVPFDSVGNPNTAKTLTYNGTSGALSVPGIISSNGVALPTVGTPTVGQVACYKAAGPPVLFGYCSTTPTGGTCTCN